MNFLILIWETYELKLRSELFFYQIQQIILHQIHQRRNDDIGVAQTESFGLADNKVFLIANFMDWFVVIKMVFGFFTGPAGIGNQSLNK